MRMLKLKHRLQLRWPHLLMYVCLITAGVVIAIEPTPTVTDQLRFFFPVWVSFFIVGGAASAYGILKGTWVGEAFGLPLASSALTIYGLILMVRFFVSSSGLVTTASFAFSLVLLAFGFGLFGRWREVLKFLKIAREMEDGH